MIVDIFFKDKIQEWLFTEFIKYRFLNELYLIGSVINKLEVNDIDVVQLIDLDSKESIKEYAIELKMIRSNFLNTFNVNLHLTSFTNTELVNFANFMSINNSIKII